MQAPPELDTHVGTDGRSGRSRSRARVLGGLLAATALAAGVPASCGDPASAALPPISLPQPAPAELPTPPEEHGGLGEVAPPPLSEETFPCSDCHDPDLPVRTERRELKLAHQDIVLKHDEENRWCIDCHDADDRDMLHLANGTLVSFEESYRLCGQCHGDKYRDWRLGIHGRRTGSWNGAKSYLLCVHCHDSHQPRFKPLKPLPPPKRPERTP